jgi:hypothetical protein
VEVITINTDGEEAENNEWITFFYYFLILKLIFNLSFGDYI